MTSSMTLLPSHPFWHFSLQIYEHDLARQALLSLQTKHGLNINLLLFACWHAATNQGQISKQEVKALLATIHHWHERIIVQLRGIRDRLKYSNGQEWTQTIRQEVLATELMAEHVEQLLLTDAYIKKPQRNRRSVQQKTTNACQNILSYSSTLFVNFDIEDCSLIAQLLKVVFNDLNPIEANNICKAILLNRPPLKKSNLQQLQLKLP